MAVVLALISLALGFHSVVGELYGEYLPEPRLVWDYLNWLIGVGVVVALVFHFRRKRALDRQPHGDDVSVEYLSTNLMLFAAIFLTLWFFANWFEVMNINDNTPLDVVGFVWIAFNASFVLLAAVTAWLMWQTPSEAVESLDNSLPSPYSPAGAETGPVSAGQSSTAGAQGGVERAIPAENPSGDPSEPGARLR